MTQAAASIAFNTKLLPHQQRVVRRLLQVDQSGLVVAHGLGSGKTATSILAQEAMGVDADIIVPAALIKNYQKEVARWAPGSSLRRNLVSMQAVVRDRTHLSLPLLIVDEGHRGRSELSQTAGYLEGCAFGRDKRRLVLTATPFYDHPVDIMPLIEVASGGTAGSVATLKKGFEAIYMEAELVWASWWGRWLSGAKPGVRWHLRQANAEGLRQDLHRYVDAHANSTAGFPRVRRTEVMVPMSEDQQREHDRLMRKAPEWVGLLVSSGLGPQAKDAAAVNAFLTASRQVCDCWGAASPKLDAAVLRLQETLASNPRAKVLVYSNFLGACLRPYAERLRTLGVPHVEFTGDEAKVARDLSVQRYNRGDVRVMLVSSAGGEGLDLVGTRVVQVLEPAFNRSRTEQVEGRAIRYGSHAHLPEAEQEVEVQSFMMRNRHGSGLSTDEYLAEMCRQKEALLGEFRALLPRET